MRAVLEGVAFGLRDSLDLRRASSGSTPALGRVSGGGARSELWLQIVASVLELPLERVAVDEGAAFGAAILGGVAAGVWPDVHAGGGGDACGRASGSSRCADWVEAYRAQRERFRALYPALRALPGVPAAGSRSDVRDRTEPSRRRRRSSTSTG